MPANTVTIGRVSIQALVDITTPARPSLMFPMSTPEKLEPFAHFINERGHFPINIGSFAVRSGGRLLLVDTGIGDKNRRDYRNGTLPASLQAAGIRPEDVDDVLITHLHFDHVGWNTVERDGTYVPFFSNARYLIQRREWEYWSRPEIAAGTDYMADCVLPLMDAGRVQLIEDETAVTEDITTMPTPGHTPGHSAIAIVSGGERGLILGDVAHHPVQLTEWEWSIAFDVDQAKARETRHALVERIELERELVIGGHFPAPGFGRLVELSGRRYWQAIKLPEG